VAAVPQTGTRKADFTAIYDRPDPRDYWRVLGGLDYEIPQQAAPIFSTLLGARRALEPPSDAPQSVVDICCSYGINAALMRCDVTLEEIRDRYTSPETQSLPPGALAEADREFYRSRTRSDAPRVVGLDVAANAVAYGQRVGVLAGGFSCDLEDRTPPDDLARAVHGIDMITITGGVGYVTERTFGRLLDAAMPGTTPWVVSFVLRMFPYEGIADALAEYGLVTERLEGRCFPQRRFASAEERDAALHDVQVAGGDPAGLEDTGRYYAELYVSRPAHHVAQASLQELLAGHVAR
jgi:hypothetical protein